MPWWPDIPSVTEYTRPATWEDVKNLARLLNEAGVQYALVGGYAIAAHGFNRFSEDIDILVNPEADNSRRWVESRGPVAYKTRCAAEGSDGRGTLEPSVVGNQELEQVVLGSRFSPQAGPDFS
jgi:Nucleotidyl transferase AbiEii toxin, Type IV TA system